MDNNPYVSPTANSSVRTRHGSGIACFAIAVVATSVEAIILPLSVYMAYSGVPKQSLVAILTMLVAVGGLLLDLVAFGLGIVGLFQRNRKRLIAVLGLIISIVPFIAVALMVLSGV